jgi:hypothetical protein
LQLVIVMPVLLLAVSLVFQAMVYYRARQAAETAARQAVDSARVIGAGPSAGRTQADDVLAQLGQPVDGPQVAVSRQGQMVVATVSGRAPMLVPGLGLRVSATAQAPEERFVP